MQNTYQKIQSLNKLENTYIKTKLDLNKKKEYLFKNKDFEFWEMKPSENIIKYYDPKLKNDFQEAEKFICHEENIRLEKMKEMYGISVT